MTSGFRTFSERDELTAKQDGIARFNPTPHILTPSFRLLSLDPHSRTPRHNHTETELWSVLRGNVEVDIEGKKVDLKEASVISLSPLQRHDIRTNDGSALLQVCFWHDQAEFESAVEAYGSTEKNSAEVSVLIPNWITPNGQLHLGHAGGPYVYADVARRALELAGHEAAYVTGTLGHLEHIAIAAKAEELEYYELADRNTASITESLRRLAIAPDIFLGPRPSTRFVEIMHEIFDSLRSINAIEERETLVPYNGASGCYVVDAHLTGVCPHCGGSTFGHECEGCGSSVLDSDLQSPTNRAGEPLAHRPLKRMFLNLAKLKGALEVFRDSAVLSSQAKSFVDSWLTRGLPAICITNPISHGVAIPVVGYEAQRFTVFMEHVARHFFAVEELTKKQGRPANWRDVSRRGNFSLNIFFGSDNSFGRLIITPAVTIGVGAASLAPKRCFLNHFLLLDGAKFSTGKNHAIWVNEFVGEHNCEPLRLFLMLLRPDAFETNFTLTDFDAHLDSFWRGDLVALVQALRAEMEKNNSAKIAPAGSWGRDEITFYKRILDMDAALRYWLRLDSFDPASVARELLNFVGDTVDFYRACDPWPRDATIDPNRKRTQSRLLVCAVIRVSVALHPFAPRASDMLAGLVGEPRLSMTTLERDWLTKVLEPLSIERLQAIEEYLLDVKRDHG